jgi:hypothetical protein
MKSGRKQRFTKLEDEMLLNLVGELGITDWNEIYRHFPLRTHRQVKDR